jgi:methyl-accepting chemotaxis protein
VSKVAIAIANGDLGQKITVDVRGEILQIKDVINKMVDQLNSFASEVTRVAKEVGTEGKLGGQANVKGVSGTWKDLTDNVNGLAANLTAQVRNIAKVTTAVAMVKKIIRAKAARGVVVKIAKTGLTEALKIVTLARKNKLHTMISCMAESARGLTTSVQWAIGDGKFDWVDLDSFLLTGTTPRRSWFGSKGPWLF